jgi:small subunit ribosomal protein S16
MVVIRLARGGAKKRPFFNLVVADSRNARDGRFIERIGFYDPKAPEGRESLRIEMERLTHWTGQGAQLSGTVSRLVKQFGRVAKAA